MMNLMHWRMVVAVADTGNITRAAERIGMTQSGASQALALIEETLGVQLFSREKPSDLADRHWLACDRTGANHARGSGEHS